MKRTWKRALFVVVAGVCGLATVADVDAGIVFRRRPGLFPGRGSNQTTTARTVAATPGAAVTTTTPATPAAPAQPAGPAAAVATTGGVATGGTATTTTTRTRNRRLGRRRNTATNQVTVAPAATTVRGQNP
jgi:hypothetical protein